MSVYYNYCIHSFCATGGLDSDNVLMSVACSNPVNVDCVSSDQNKLYTINK